MRLVLCAVEREIVARHFWTAPTEKQADYPTSPKSLAHGLTCMYKHLANALDCIFLYSKPRELHCVKLWCFPVMEEQTFNAHEKDRMLRELAFH